MSYLETDLRREVLLACNKARVSVAPADIQATLTDISGEIGDWEAGQSPPSNTKAPAISGTPTVGETLTLTPGDWTGAPSARRYQWQGDGAPISGATGTTLVLGDDQEGQAVTGQEWASNAAGEGGPATSAATAAVAPAAE
jgi:hypothetical protein